MTLIATSDARVSNAIKHEYEPSVGFCRRQVSAYEAGAKTYVSGSTVLGRFLASGSASATAGAGNTGTGTVGTITVSGSAKIGTYSIRIQEAVTNKGVFTVYDPYGYSVGSGQVGSVFAGGGLSFTISDGTDFVVGDTFTIAVTGTEYWKIVESTATDGSQIADGIFLCDQYGNFRDTAISATTATKIVILERGPAVVAKEGLSYGASIDTTAEKNALYAQLEAKGIRCDTQI